MLKGVKFYEHNEHHKLGRTRAGYCLNTPCVLMQVVWTS